MIISELTYLEDATQEIFGGTKKKDFMFDKYVNSEVKNSFDYDGNVDIDVNFNKDSSIYSAADIKGNIATLSFDIEAVGKDTDTEAAFSVLTVEDHLSSIGFEGSSAVGK